MTSHGTKETIFTPGRPSRRPSLRVSWHCTNFKRITKIHNRSAWLCADWWSAANWAWHSLFFITSYLSHWGQKKKRRNKGERKSSSPTGGKNVLAELRVHVWLSYEFVSPPEEWDGGLRFTPVGVQRLLLCSQLNTKAKKWHVKKTFLVARRYSCDKNSSLLLNLTAGFAFSFRIPERNVLLV